MSAKKKSDEERKPDLNEGQNQAELEQRIKEMMELEPPKQAKKAISVSMGEDDSLSTAPELPAAKGPLSIKIVDHNEVADAAGAPEPEMVETPDPAEDDPEVAAAIAEANKQLLNPVETPEPDDAEEESGEPEESEPTDILEAESGNQPEETAEEDTLITAPELEEEPETSEAEETELPEETEPPKEKPLKHLDSIVPKNKVEETIESEKTEEAVEDIIAKESDALLEAEDEKLAQAFQPEPRPSFGHKLKSFFGNKTVRRIVLLLVLAGTIAATLFPASRYFVLNAAGVRSSASLRVLDDSTQQPLKGVTVRLAGKSTTTDQDGRATFKEIRLGSTQLIIEKRAFALLEKDLVVGWGSNPLPEFKLRPTGSQYVFKVTDFLSGKPVAKVEAASNDASAISNEKGEIRLTIDAADDAEREVIISGEGYRQERFKLNLDQKETRPIHLVPSRKHVFISNRSGRLDVYKVDIDGQNEELILPGTGSERDDMVLVSHPGDEAAALVSTKDNKRNADGFLLSTLTVLNLNDETSKSVVTSERVQIVDWVDSKIVFVTVKEGASGVSPDRHKLSSYDYKTGELKELAASNYFNDVMAAGGKVYYAPTSTYSGATNSALYQIDADGGNKKTILDQEVWNIFRSSFDRLTLAVQQDWYELKIGETSAGKISGEPPDQSSRIYVNSPDIKRSLWVDIRDGKGVLLAYDLEKNEDTTVRTQGGLKQPVRWLTNNTIVYRINTEAETADYALNLEGGEPKKIRDVANTSGVNTWYYY
jgi:hypothetical protein